MGVIPWEQTFGRGAKNAFRDPNVCAPLDFLSVHYYPHDGKLDDDLTILKLYDIGKPVVIEEIFPLGGSIGTTEAFIKGSRPIANGWISFYWGTTPAEYEKSRDKPNAKSIANWIRRFTAMRDEMVSSR